MATDKDRLWTAHIVIAFQDRTLNQLARALEDEMRHVLARVDEPERVRDYLVFLTGASRTWLTGDPVKLTDK